MIFSLRIFRRGWASFIPFRSTGETVMSGFLWMKLKDFASIDGVSAVYISTDHIGLYEKYSCEFIMETQDMNGESTRVYAKQIS